MRGLLQTILSIGMQNRNVRDPFTKSMQNGFHYKFTVFRLYVFHTWFVRSDPEHWHAKMDFTFQVEDLKLWWHLHLSVWTSHLENNKDELFQSSGPTPGTYITHLRISFPVIMCDVNTVWCRSCNQGKKKKKAVSTESKTGRIVPQAQGLHLWACRSLCSLEHFHQQHPRLLSVWWRWHQRYGVP